MTDSVEAGLQRHKDAGVAGCDGWIHLSNGVQLRCWVAGHPKASQEAMSRPRRRGRPTRERRVVTTEKSAPKPSQPLRGIRFKTSGEARPSTPYADIAWAKGERTCMWCEKPVKKKEGGGHHVLPRSLGGGDEPSNIRLVHEGFCHDRIEGLTQLVGREPTREQIRQARSIA